VTAHLLGRTGRAAGLDAHVREIANIGADPNNEVCLSVEGVSRRHARVSLQGAEYWIEDLRSTNGTYLNGQRVSRERLRHLDVITLGRDVDVIFVESRGQLPADGPAVVAAEIKWRDGELTGETLQLQRGETTFGRAAANTVVVEHAAVSKVHLRLQLTADQLLAEDQGSANGTLVNGKKLMGTTPLESGDVVSLAGSRSFEIVMRRRAPAGPASRNSSTQIQPVFDNEWKTRLVWSPDELARIEAERDRAVRQAEEILRLQGMQAPSADEISVGQPTPKPPSPASPMPQPPAPRPAVEQNGPGARAGETSDGANGVAVPSFRPTAAESGPQSPERLTSPAGQGVAVPQFLGTSVEHGNSDAPSARGAARGTVDAGAGAMLVPPQVMEAADARRPVEGSPDARSADDQHPITKIVLAGASSQHVLECGDHVIGRAVDCAVRIDSPDVSRHHAQIRVTVGGVEVTDLGSPNGTLVNGRPISGARALHATDILTVGSRSFRLDIVRTAGRPQ
jgi:pSer/pThr/pTyr-binding forkhead associated (FHA) protein